jgi:LmbE family N-acetylglucosaminyl deacetylase
VSEQEAAAGPAEEREEGPVLGVFAHPDDAEISAGGTLARWTSEGREVHLMILTNGDRGSDDAARDRRELAEIRRKETAAAAELLGLASATIGEVHDGELANTEAVREPVVRRIRQIGARTVISCDPTAVFFDNRYYNHSDHRMAGWVALDSVFPGSGNPHFFSEHLAEGLTVQPVTDVWLGWSNEPNRRQDVTGFLRMKLDALHLHASQFDDEALDRLEEWIPREAIEAGKEIGVEHAESFRVLDLS